MGDMEGVFDVDLLHRHIAEQQRRLDNAKHMYEAFKGKFEDAVQTVESLRDENALLKKQLAVALGRMGTAVRRESLRQCAEDELTWQTETEKIQSMIQIAAVDAEMVGIDWKRRRHASMNGSVMRLQRSLSSAQRHLSLVRARMHDMSRIEDLVNQLCVSARNGDAEAVMQLIVESGVNIHETDEGGLNALHYAAMGGHMELVQLLVEHGAEVQGMSTNHAPLVLAAKYDHTEVAQALVDHGALVDATDAAGLSPLATSTSHGHIESMRLLIKLGADVNVQDIEGNTALHMAIEQRRVEAIQLLLQSGADITIANVHGNNAKKSALSTQDKSVIEAIKPFIAQELVTDS